MLVKNPHEHLRILPRRPLPFHRLLETGGVLRPLSQERAHDVDNVSEESIVLPIKV